MINACGEHLIIVTISKHPHTHHTLPICAAFKVYTVITVLVIADYKRYHLVVRGSRSQSRNSLHNRIGARNDSAPTSGLFPARIQSTVLLTRGGELKLIWVPGDSIWDWVSSIWVRVWVGIWVWIWAWEAQFVFQQTQAEFQKPDLSFRGSGSTQFEFWKLKLNWWELNWSPGNSIWFWIGVGYESDLDRIWVWV